MFMLSASRIPRCARPLVLRMVLLRQTFTMGEARAALREGIERGKAAVDARDALPAGKIAPRSSDVVV